MFRMSRVQACYSAYADYFGKFPEGLTMIYYYGKKVRIIDFKKIDNGIEPDETQD